MSNDNEFNNFDKVNQTKTVETINIDTVTTHKKKIKKFDASDKALDNKNSEFSQKNKKDKKRNNTIFWTIKITLITFFIAGFFSLISEFTNLLHFSISIVLLILLIMISLIADAIGVAVTSCDPEPIYAMASRKEPKSKQAMLLIRNSEKVSNICCDVIGDICGIVSGACLIALIVKMTYETSDNIKLFLSIIFSSIVAAITVGGKAFLKDLAVNKSKQIVLATAKLIAFFYNPKDSTNKKKRK